MKYKIIPTPIHFAVRYNYPPEKWSIIFLDSHDPQELHGFPDRNTATACVKQIKLREKTFLDD